MPAKGTSRVTDAQRRTLAAGRLAGKTAKQLATATGMAKKTVERQLKDPRTVAYAQGYKARDEADLAEMWKLMLKRLKKDIDSADADVRSRARMAFMKLLVLGEAPLERITPPGPQGGDFTLEELLTVHRMDFIAIGTLKAK